jgi:hypothetical protein
MAGGYGHNPKGAEGVAKRIREIERDLDKLRQSITHLGIEIDPDTNSLVVSSGRGIRVNDVAGNTVAIIGTQPGLERADGSPQAGVSLYREDGSIAEFLGDANPTVPPFKQSLQIYDRAGNVVMADDTNSGKGLAAPWVTGGCILGDTNTANWPQTTSGSFVTIAAGWYRVQNPRLAWDINMVCDTGTAGELRVLVGGVQVDTTQTVGGSFIDWYRNLGAPGGNVALPAGVGYNSIVLVELQARRTSGAGTVYATPQRFEGDQSP